MITIRPSFIKKTDDPWSYIVVHDALAADRFAHDVKKTQDPFVHPFPDVIDMQVAEADLTTAKEMVTHAAEHVTYHEPFQELTRDLKRILQTELDKANLPKFGQDLFNLLAYGQFSAYAPPKRVRLSQRLAKRDPMTDINAREVLFPFKTLKGDKDDIGRDEVPDLNNLPDAFYSHAAAIFLVNGPALLGVKSLWSVVRDDSLSPVEAATVASTIVRARAISTATITPVLGLLGMSALWLDRLLDFDPIKAYAAAIVSQPDSYAQMRTDLRAAASLPSWEGLRALRGSVRIMSARAPMGTAVPVLTVNPAVAAMLNGQNPWKKSFHKENERRQFVFGLINYAGRIAQAVKLLQERMKDSMSEHLTSITGALNLTTDEFTPKLPCLGDELPIIYTDGTSTSTPVSDPRELCYAITLPALRDNLADMNHMNPSGELVVSRRLTVAEFVTQIYHHRKRAQLDIAIADEAHDVAGMEMPRGFWLQPVDGTAKGPRYQGEEGAVLTEASLRDVQIALGAGSLDDLRDMIASSSPAEYSHLVRTGKDGLEVIIKGRMFMSHRTKRRTFAYIPAPETLLPTSIKPVLRFRDSSPEAEPLLQYTVDGVQPSLTALIPFAAQ